MMATMTGMKIVLMRKWNVEEGMRIHYTNSCENNHAFPSFKVPKAPFVPNNLRLQLITSLIRTENVTIAGGFVFH